MANARKKHYRSGTKGSAKSKLPCDPGGHHVPGMLGREKVKTTQGRTGYTEEKRLGPGGRGRVITLPSG